MRISALLAPLVVVSGCVSSEPIPELLMAAKPGLTNPSAVAGAEYQACVEDSQARRRKLLTPNGVYEPGFTYKFAETMHGSKAMEPFSLKVRAYSIVYERTPLFGRPVPTKVICYYELKDGGLRYLVSLGPDGDGRVEMQLFTSAVLRAYAKMAGKNPTAVVLLGPWAG